MHIMGRPRSMSYTSVLFFKTPPEGSYIDALSHLADLFGTCPIPLLWAIQNQKRKGTPDIHEEWH